MKIKLAILDLDKNYLSRMAAAFASKYSQNVELYSFTEEKIAIDSLSNDKIDVFLASSDFEIDITAVPKHCGFAYFVEALDVEAFRGQGTICKFQKAEMIYKEVLSLFSEKVAYTTGIKFDNDSHATILTFVSASGGVGSSTVAAACALYFSKIGKKVLYINLEQCGIADTFFSGEGMFDFSDVIFSIKSKKTNLSLKLESHVKQDPSGVYFYSSTKTALDIMELNIEDIEKLISELNITGTYDYIIFDADFSLNKANIELFKRSKSIVFVSDGSEISNMKFSRAFKAFEIMQEQADISIIPKIVMIYNKFSNKTSKIIEGENFRVIGGAPKFEHASSEQIIQQLLSMNIFVNLMN